VLLYSEYLYIFCVEPFVFYVQNTFDDSIIGCCKAALSGLSMTGRLSWAQLETWVFNGTVLSSNLSKYFVFPQKNFKLFNNLTQTLPQRHASWYESKTRNIKIPRGILWRTGLTPPLVLFASTLVPLPCPVEVPCTSRWYGPGLHYKICSLFLSFAVSDSLCCQKYQVF